MRPPEIRSPGDLALFYLVVPLGFEAIAQTELQQWLQKNDLRSDYQKIFRGGIEILLPLSLGVMMNQQLGVPSRVLLRLFDFGCRDFPKLYKKIRGFQWQNWLAPNCEPEFEASSSASRLRIKTRIEETGWDGLKSSPWGQLSRTATQYKQKIFIRFESDICTVSLDTSGELLYRRGLRKLVSEAPIRENLAHGLWRILADRPASSREVTLVDPMMGSGVFGLEARFADLVSSREYAYQHIPILQSAFASLHKAEMDIRMKKFIGFENSHSVVEAARQNFAGLGSVEVEVFEQDFFSPKKDFSLLKDETQETWVISNLPYGERIKIKDESLLSFYQRVVDEIETWCRPHRVGLLVADKFEPSRLRHKKWSTPQVFKFKNGGLEVQFLIWKRL